MFSEFFINRPRFAAVVSLIIIIGGIIAIAALPIQEYPSVVPPQVVVEAIYPGADADTLAKTVASPIEDSINGVRDLLYMTSTASPTGVVNTSVFFEIVLIPAVLLWMSTTEFRLHLAGCQMM